jgi:hypothetical protein
MRLSVPAAMIKAPSCVEPGMREKYLPIAHSVYACATNAAKLSSKDSVLDAVPRCSGVPREGSVRTLAVLNRSRQSAWHCEAAATRLLVAAAAAALHQRLEKDRPQRRFAASLPQATGRQQTFACRDRPALQPKLLRPVKKWPARSSTGRPASLRCHEKVPECNCITRGDFRRWRSVL